MRSPVSPDLVSISAWTADLQSYCPELPCPLWLPLGFGQERCWQDIGGAEEWGPFKTMASSLWSHIRLAVTVEQRSFDRDPRSPLIIPGIFHSVSSSQCQCLTFAHPLGLDVGLALLLTQATVLVHCGSPSSWPRPLYTDLSLQTSQIILLCVPSY